MFVDRTQVFFFGDRRRYARSGSQRHSNTIFVFPPSRPKGEERESNLDPPHVPGPALAIGTVTVRVSEPAIPATGRAGRLRDTTVRDSLPRYEGRCDLLRWG
jgi:hypothetical protein